MVFAGLLNANNFAPLVAVMGQEQLLLLVVAVVFSIREMIYFVNNMQMKLS